jgi:hypothetical protein
MEKHSNLCYVTDSPPHKNLVLEIRLVLGVMGSSLQYVFSFLLKL